MLCMIWYQLYNLKNVKNTHGGMLLLVKLQAKSKSRKASHIYIYLQMRYAVNLQRNFYTSFQKRKKTFSGKKSNEPNNLLTLFKISKKTKALNFT